MAKRVKTVFDFIDTDIEEVKHHLASLRDEARNSGKSSIFKNIMTFSPEIACALGVTNAIILDQIFYWLVKSQKPEKLKDGRYWTYGSYSQWRRDNFSFISEIEVRQSIRKLEQLGILISRQEDRTKWYAFNEEVFIPVLAEKLKEFLEKEDKRQVKARAADERRWAVKREKKEQKREKKGQTDPDKIYQGDRYNLSGTLIKKISRTNETSTDTSTGNLSLLDSAPTFSRHTMAGQEDILIKENISLLPTNNHAIAAKTNDGPDLTSDSTLSGMDCQDPPTLDLPGKSYNADSVIDPDEEGRYPKKVYNDLFDLADAIETYEGSRSYLSEKGAIKSMLHDMTPNEIIDLIMKKKERGFTFCTIENDA